MSTLEVSPPRVLLVDDSSSRRLFFRGLVLNVLPEWTIYEASALEAALQLIENHREFAVAIVDLYLDDPAVRQDGLEVLRALRRSCSTCFHILITGRLMAYDVSDDGHVDAFVSTSSHIRDYQSLLEEALEEAERRLRRRNQGNHY